MKSLNRDQVLRKLFGEDGDIASERMVQVMVISASIVVTGEFLITPLLGNLAGFYSVTEATVSQFMVAVLIPQVVLVPFAGILADRIGRRAVLVPGLIIFAISGTALAFTRSFEVALVLRFVQGIGFAAVMPMTMTVFGDLYEGSREATAQGLRNAGLGAVNVISPAIAGVLFIVSWRIPFLIFILALPVALWAWRVMPDIRPAQKTSFGGYVKNLISLLRWPVMALVLLSTVLRFGLLFGVLTYVSVLATNELELAVSVIGILVSIFGLFSLLAATQVGRFVTRIDPALFGGVSFGIAGVGVTLIGVAPAVSTLIAGLVIYGIGDGFVGPLQKTLVNLHSPTNLRAGAMSTATTFMNLGKVIGPVVMAPLLPLIGTPNTFVVIGVFGGGIGAITLLGIVWLNNR